MRKLALVLVLSVLGSALTLADDPTPPADADRVEKLIGQLGSASFRQREAATKALDAVGEPALDALRKAAQSPDMETQRRAAELVQRIGKRAENARLIAPTTVELKLKDVPVTEAVAELARQGKCKIALGRTAAPLSAARVTLDTGKASFWVAFDRLCREAGLTDSNGIPAAADAQLAEAIRSSGRLPTVPADGVIVLELAEAKDVATSYAGAFRVRAPAALSPLSADAKPADGELVVGLSIRPELKLGYGGLIGFKIDNAIDDRGQNLTPVLTPPQNDSAVEILNGPGGQAVILGRNGGRQMAVAPGGPAVTTPAPAALRFKKGAEPTTALKELSGTAAVRVMAPARAVVAIDNVLKAKGETARSPSGTTSLRVNEVSRDDDGSVRVVAELHYTNDVTPVGQEAVDVGERLIQFQGAGQIQLQGQIRVGRGASAPPQLGTTFVGLELLDGDGKPYQIQLVPSHRSRMTRNASGTSFAHQATIDFRPAVKDQGEPARLVFKATHWTTADVPFTLKNVPVK